MEDTIFALGSYIILFIGGGIWGAKRIWSKIQAADNTEQLAAEALEEKVDKIPQLEERINQLKIQSEKLSENLNNQIETNVALNILVKDQESRLITMSNDIERLRNQVDSLTIENQKLNKILAERGDVLNKTERERDIAQAKYEAISSTLKKININISSMEVESGNSTESEV